MGAATPLVEALRNFIRIALLLAARLLARSLGSVDSKNRHYYIRAEPFEPMTARSDDKVDDKVGDKVGADAVGDVVGELVGEHVIPQSAGHSVARS